VVAEDNQPFRVGEGEGAKQYSFNQGKDGSCGPDAECQCDDNDLREAG
jgi:hypothetical protein